MQTAPWAKPGCDCGACTAEKGPGHYISFGSKTPIECVLAYCLHPIPRNHVVQAAHDFDSYGHKEVESRLSKRRADAAGFDDERAYQKSLWISRRARDLSNAN
jgi:hypothetical protein